MNNDRIIGGDHEDPQTAPSDGGGTQNTPGVEVIEVTPPKVVVKMKGGTREMYDVPSDTSKFVDDSEIRGS